MPPWIVAFTFILVMRSGSTAQGLAPGMDSTAVVRELVQEAARYYRSDDLARKFQLLQEAGRSIPGVKDADLRLYYLSLMGNTLWHLGLQEEAFNTYRELIRTSEQAPQSPDNMLWRYAGQMGSAYLSIDELDSAQHYFTLGRDAAKLVEGPWYPAALNNLGIAYLKQQDTGMAMVYFDSATAALRTHDLDSRLLAASIRDNRIDVDLIAGRKEEAIAKLRTNLDSLRSIGLKYDQARNNYMRYRFKLVDLYLRSGRPVEARTELAELEQFIHRPGGTPGSKSLLRAAELHEALARAKGDTREILTTTIRLAALRDSTAQVQLDQRSLLIRGLSALSLVQFKGEMDAKLKLSQAQARAADDRARSRTVLAVLITLFSLITLISLTMWWRARVRHKQVEKELVESELEFKRKDLQQMGLEFAQRKERAEKLVQLAATLDHADKERAAAAAAELKAAAKAEVRLEDRREWLHQQVEVVNSAFYEALHQRYPHLAPTEIELCGLIRSGFSNQEVAELRNITPKSARMARYRLKRKLGATPDEDIEEVLRAL